MIELTTTGKVFVLFVSVAIAMLLIILYRASYRTGKSAKGSVSCGSYFEEGTAAVGTSIAAIRVYRTPLGEVKHDKAGRDITPLTSAQEYLVRDFFVQYNYAKSRSSDKSTGVQVYLTTSVGETLTYRAQTQKDLATLLNAIFGVNKGLSTYQGIAKSPSKVVETVDD